MNIEKWENLMSVNLNLEERQNTFFLQKKCSKTNLHNLTIKCWVEF